MKIPALWGDVLVMVQHAFPGAIIAGGALRDLYHDKPIKDVDVFIPFFGEPDLDDIKIALQAVKDTLDKQDDIEIDDVFGMMLRVDENVQLIAASWYGQSDLERDVVAVFSATIKGTKFDFVFMRQMKEHMLPSFDINICQIGYDANTWFTTNDFDSGVRDKTLRVMNVNRNDRNAKRLARVSEKYPEYIVEGK